ncbi:MAG: hypothetical protein MK321_12125, partial [Pseudomonadales bacterium]|nr:hypothetical protein [Pseudomonadales bacterium]
VVSSVEKCGVSHLLSFCPEKAFRLKLVLSVARHEANEHGCPGPRECAPPSRYRSQLHRYDRLYIHKPKQ